MGSCAAELSQCRFVCREQSTLFTPLIKAPLGVGELSLPGERVSLNSPSEGSWYQSWTIITRSVS